MARGLGFVTAALAAVVLSMGPGGATGAGSAECGVPATAPLWIDYGEGTVRPDTRAVFARAGVVVATSGSTIPKFFRDRGAVTQYWVLHLPGIVGQPSAPADPATIDAAADRLLAQAVASSACSTPWIALNELAGSGIRPPWSATNTQYRANVLELLRRLSSRGAHPALLVHGDPYVGGTAGDWWRQAGQAAAAIVYEAYYNASNIDRLGAIVGNRRMRLGMRSILRAFGSAGVPAAKTAFMLGFQSAPGAAGREGLQPREEWFRVVKWTVLAARQVAYDARLSTLWSWGWGTFGPESVDPDKPGAACVYLWTRDPALCDGPGAAGPAFNTSLTEGQIVLPAGVQCAFAGGQVTTRSLVELTQLTRDRHVALTALFARAVLRARVPVTQAEVLRAERAVITRAFRGSRKAYVRALTRRHATLAVARGILADELRRARIAAQLRAQGSPQTPLEWTADVESAAADTATCLRDELPGSGNFPSSNALELGATPLPAYLPFLVGDHRAPGAPAGLLATVSGGTVTLDWADRPERDLIGYWVYRASAPGGPYRRLTASVIDRSTFSDSSAPRGAPAYYVVRALDSSRNVGPASVEVTATPT